jgi:uncharacterized Zn-finger protein
MADTVTPYFVNDVGSENIRVGVKKFKCMGATPPNDHPHVFLDMGAADTIICPYCSTLYVFDEEFASEQTDPPHCVFNEKAA